jgi:hypothetical protein
VGEHERGAEWQSGRVRITSDEKQKAKTWKKRREEKSDSCGRENQGRSQISCMQLTILKGRM